MGDSGLLLSMLEKAVQEDVRIRRNLGTWKGALFENIVSEALVKAGASLAYYRKENSTLERGKTMTNLKMKTVVLCCAVAVAFVGGVAVGHWAWPNGDVDGAAEAGEDVTVEADEASDEEGGVVAQKDGEDADGKFVEAVPAEPEKDDEDQAGEATASGSEADAEDYRLMNQADRTVRENAQAEHAALREALGRSLGLQGEELREFGETLKAIDDSVGRH